jgi:glutamate transport system ATP-binding protein
MIRMTSVDKHFGDLHVLRDINLEVDTGQVVVVLGPSGSGKSTLCRTINRLEPIDSGVIEVDGNKLPEEGKGLAGLRADVGMVFQSFNLFAHKTILENVTLAPIKVRKMGKAEAEKHGLALLERVGIANQKDKYPAQLSGGQQQRAAIARALVQGAEFIIADEPIASLDPHSARRVMDILADLNQRDGITVLISLHQVEYALRYCSRIIALRAGEIVYDGPSRALTPDFLCGIYGAESQDLFGSIEPVPLPANVLHLEPAAVAREPAPVEHGPVMPLDLPRRTQDDARRRAHA